MVHMTALTIMGPPLFLTATGCACLGVNALQLFRGVVPRPLAKPYPVSDSDRHIRPSSARIVVARPSRPAHAVRAYQGISGSCPWVSGRGAGISTSRLPAGSAVPSPRVRAASGACRSAGSAQDVASTRTAWVGPQIVSST